MISGPVPGKRALRTAGSPRICGGAGFFVQRQKAYIVRRWLHIMVINDKVRQTDANTYKGELS